MDVLCGGSMSYSLKMGPGSLEGWSQILSFTVLPFFCFVTFPFCLNLCLDLSFFRLLRVLLHISLDGPGTKGLLHLPLWGTFVLSFVHRSVTDSVCVFEKDVLILSYKVANACLVLLQYCCQ